MAKVKRPKIEDYLIKSKGQGIGTLVGQSTSIIVHS